jgi:hypothetical protein
MERSAPVRLEDHQRPERHDQQTAEREDSQGARTGEQVTLDVRQLAQLYAGYLPARQLVRGGLIKPGSAKAVELLEVFFPPGDPWLFPPDHF